MRVLLIDDHALFRAGLEGLLQQRGIDVLAAVGNGEEGLRLATKLEIDIILLDLRMPGFDGLSVLAKIRESGVATPVVLLTMSNEEQDLVNSLQQGAQGYLLKDMDPDQLVIALHDIVAGDTVVAPELAAILAKVVQHGTQEEVFELAAPFNGLTPRELEILCCVSEGCSNKTIARDLGITDGTVKLHMKAILRKLNAQSRVEAAVMAVEGGICQKSR